MTTPLRQRMIEEMRIRNFTEKTQISYVQYVATIRPALSPLARRPGS
jgi:hypothetical protein